MGDVIQLHTCDICNKLISGEPISAVRKRPSGDETNVKVHKECMLQKQVEMAAMQIAYLENQLNAAHSMMCTILDKSGGRITLTNAEVKAAMATSGGKFDVTEERPGVVTLSISRIIKPNGAFNA